MEAPGVLPHLDGLSSMPVSFRTDRCLDRLPEKPGLIVVNQGRFRMRQVEGVTFEDFPLGTLS